MKPSTLITMKNLSYALAHGTVASTRKMRQRPRAASRIYPADTPRPAIPVNGVSPLGGRAK